MKKLLTSALLAVAIATPGQANTARMPDALAGEWCQTSGTNDIGDYIKAKNFCKETRPLAVYIHPVGFWIKLATVKTRVLCIPLRIEDYARGWLVVADCGAEDNSTPVYRFGFTFEISEPGRIAMTRFAWNN